MKIGSKHENVQRALTMKKQSPRLTLLEIKTNPSKNENLNKQNQENKDETSIKNKISQKKNLRKMNKRFKTKT